MTQFGLFIIGEKEFERMPQIEKDVLLDEVKCSNNESNILDCIGTTFDMESVEDDYTIPEELKILNGMVLKDNKIKIDIEKIKEEVIDRFQKIKDKIDKMEIKDFMMNKDEIVNELDSVIDDTLLVDCNELVSSGLGCATYTATDYTIKKLRNDENTYLVLGCFRISY